MIIYIFISIILIKLNNSIGGNEPSNNAQSVDQYNSGEIGPKEKRAWLRYQESKENKRNENDKCRYESFHSINDIKGIPKQSQFPEIRIQKWGSMFLCTCVKGGLTTIAQCMDCFNWGMRSGKLRSSDCYVNCSEEQWAREISARYGTPYHGDYVFQRNSQHFWLIQNGKEIYNSKGIGWRQ